MKVIAKGPRETLICEVNKTELEKFMNLYYNKMPTPEIGDFIDLSKGYDFAQDTLSALRATESFIEKNAVIVRSITNGIRLFKAAEEA